MMELLKTKVEQDLMHRNVAVVLDAVLRLALIATSMHFLYCIIDSVLFRIVHHQPR